MSTELVPTLRPDAFPWEGGKPIANVNGFKQAVGTVVVSLGYAIYKEAVLLYATLQMGPAPPQIWRYHWTSYLEAEKAAGHLCAVAMEYLQSMQAPMRPEEDADFDDFIEHLSARINNDFH